MSRFAPNWPSRSTTAGCRWAPSWPTVRQFAKDLDIAANTVARAYRELEAAGLLETRGRAGTFVGSNGDEGRARAAAAATEYVSVIDELGISRADGLAIVRAALER